MGKTTCLGEEKGLGRSVFVALKRRPFYTERKRETCGKKEKCNGLGSADERQGILGN